VAAKNVLIARAVGKPLSVTSSVMSPLLSSCSIKILLITSSPNHMHVQHFSSPAFLTTGSLEHFWHLFSNHMFTKSFYVTSFPFPIDNESSSITSSSKHMIGKTSSPPFPITWSQRFFITTFPQFWGHYLLDSTQLLGFI
jgi:hypothetical protein